MTDDRRPAAVVNFGGNVRFTPRCRYEPRSEEELLEVLEHHRDGQIRVVASRHSWSGAIVSGDALVDMRHFHEVRVHREEGGTFVTVGAGCQVKHLLAALDREGLTIPSVGLITEQTVAGAISTGTHGSGRHSLSHYPVALRIACYEGGEPTIRTVSGGAELRAARCAVGCLGVIVEVTLPCVPQYQVTECVTLCDSLREVLAERTGAPLQQFYLIPHLWRYYSQQRAVAAATTRSRSAPLYRLYWLLNLDIGLHLLIKVFASFLRSRRRIRFLYRHILPALAVRGWEVTDRSDRMLVMEHELFRHLEMELFVPEERLEEATEYLIEVLRVADAGRTRMSELIRERLDRAGHLRTLERLRGTYSHHYPICYRRVLPDDTLISMAAGEGVAWYAISLITYVRRREPFYAVARFLATTMAEMYEARLHWGKWFPLGEVEVRRMYPALDEFRAVCDRFDPRGVFRNDFTARVLGVGR
jgi:FAD/FMN-containing dehydrogenase